MNAFADWLFSLLFGWMGGAANRAWNAIANAGGGLSSFFSKYWLILLLLAILIGTVMDYAVWLLRWKPYLVWRSWLARAVHRRRAQRTAQELEQAEMDEAARGALAGWAAAPEDSSPIDYDPAYYPVPQAAADQPAWQEEAFYPQEAAVWQGSSLPYEEGAALYDSPDQQAYDPAGTGWQGFAPAPESAFLSYQPGPDPEQTSPLGTAANQPLIDYSPAYGAYDPAAYGDGQYADQPEQEPYGQDMTPGEAAGGRRRRSLRRQRPITQKLLEGIRQRVGRSEDEEGMLDGLPPAVRPEDAFHEAVYPAGYHYQPPDSGARSDGQP